MADEVHFGVVGVEGLLFVGSSAELMEGSLAGGDVDVDFEDGPDEYGGEGEYHVVEGDGPGEPERLT